MHFFNEIADILQKNWILQVCKIMDNESVTIKGVKQETISIKLINRRLKDESLLTTQFESIANEILSYGNILLPARHKIVAHLDRHHTLNGIALGDHNPEALDKFLCNIQNYCDEVGRAIGESSLDFKSSSCDGDAYSLLQVLKTHFKDKP